MASERQVAEVREKITAKKIKLWLPPYTVEGHDIGNYSQEFLEELMRETNFTSDIVLDALEQLRSHSISKLALRTKFQETGNALLRVKIISSSQHQLPERLNLEMNLQNKTSQLKEELSHQLSLPAASMKIIAQGKVLQDDSTLEEQNVKHEMQLMVLLMSGESLEENDHAILYQARQDAELLSSIDTDDPKSKHYLQIADQTGKPLNLPRAERKALVIALTFHEKGRSYIKNRHYSQALLFFLEADHEFNQCSAEILRNVDNYGLLNLDIAWCYLCLRSLVHLPNAASRLASCEECLYRSYGTNLERLHAIKGGSSKELVLFARLHLLQGIVAYHQNKYETASRLLHQAAEEMRELKVDDGKLSQLLEMGYGIGESRLALRGAQGNVPMAIQQILQQTELKAELKQKEKEERQQKKLGKTANGEWVNVQFYNMLLSMGFPHSEAIQSLQNANNNVSLAVQILQDQRHLLASTSSDNPMIGEENIAQLASLGFDPDRVRNILELTKGNVEAAMEKLTSNFLNDKREIARLEETHQAVHRLADDIPREEEEYLDNTMTEEETFLAEYLAYL